MMRINFKNGIALLTTLFFLMAITISIGVGLKHINEAKSSIKDENFLLQTNIILDDVLTLLKDSPELKLIKNDTNGEALDMFLLQSEFIPFEVSGLKMAISIKSARSKININELLENNTSIDTLQIEQFKKFLNEYNINLAYADMLRDSVSKNDLNYVASTDILDAKPYVFRDYITSQEHLAEINEHYKSTFYENSLSHIDFKELFYMGRESNETKPYCIDNTYMTPWVRHMIEDMPLEDAQQFEGFDDNRSEINGFKLCKDEESRRYIDVSLEILQDKKTANINFEYDIQQAKGYNFSYEI